MLGQSRPSCKAECQCGVVLTPYFLAGEPGPDYLTVQRTPNKGRSCEFGDVELMVKVPGYRYGE